MDRKFCTGNKGQHLMYVIPENATSEGRHCHPLDPQAVVKGVAGLEYVTSRKTVSTSSEQNPYTQTTTLENFGSQTTTGVSNNLDAHVEVERASANGRRTAAHDTKHVSQRQYINVKQIKDKQKPSFIFGRIGSSIVSAEVALSDRKWVSLWRE